jgi:hypothetical protein
MCIFEYVYFARPDSSIDGVNVHEARSRAGAFLALEHPVQADIVIGVPDSGLDAASRTQQMEILREIANNDKIVMVISHEPDDAVNVETGESLFTKVVVIAKSAKDNAGHLAYFGDTQGALEHFGVKKLQDIMIEINPPYEGGKGLADVYIDKYQMMQRRPHYE